MTTQTYNSVWEQMSALVREVSDKAAKEAAKAAAQEVLATMNLENHTLDNSAAAMTTINGGSNMAKLQRHRVQMPDGSMKWIQGTDINSLLQDYLKKAGTAIPCTDAPLFASYTQNDWFNDYKVKKLQPTTANQYRYMLKRHILPAFKDKRLNEITRKDIQHFFNLREKLSESYCQQLASILISVFDMALEDGYIKENPARSKRITMSSRKTEREPLPYAEACRISSMLFKLNENDRLVMLILMNTGVRRGEALGLQWRDIDFDREVITVGRQATFISNRPIVKAPKSKAGFRFIPMMSDELKSALSERYRKVNPLPTDFVLSGSEALSERSWRNTWQRISKALSLDKNCTPHVLRHTFLTFLQQRTHIDTKTIQYIAGHSNFSETMNTYVHATPENVMDVNKYGSLYAAYPASSLA